MARPKGNWLDQVGQVDTTGVFPGARSSVKGVVAQPMFEDTEKTTGANPARFTPADPEGEQVPPAEFSQHVATVLDTTGSLPGASGVQPGEPAAPALEPEPAEVTEYEAIEAIVDAEVEEDLDEDDEAQLEDLTVEQLKDIARERDLTGYSGIHKEDLVAMVQEDLDKDASGAQEGEGAEPSPEAVEAPESGAEAHLEDLDDEKLRALANDLDVAVPANRETAIAVLREALGDDEVEMVATYIDGDGTEGDETQG